jgi:hypothetical protein
MRIPARLAGIALAALALLGLGACGGSSGGSSAEVRIPLGAGGVGFLPLLALPEGGLIESAAGFSVDELVEVLRHPDIRFTTTPENTQKYAEFMREIGSIENRLASWRELFFP